MGFSCGFLGLPNVGKSTLFNALSAAGAEVESYPFCTTEAQIGTIKVPDEKLDRLAEIIPEKEKVHTKIEFYDLAGLVQGAHAGEGLGNRFLAEIRGVDALVHVVRCFRDPEVPRGESSRDPEQDIETINTELMLKDLETVENRLASLEEENNQLKEMYEELKRDLEAGIPLRDHQFSDSQIKELKSLSPLTLKPVLYVANVSEDSPPSCLQTVKDQARQENTRSLVINGEIEAEVRELDLEEEERRNYLKEWDLQESALERLIRAGYKLLDLVTFYTTDGPEVRAWTVPEGSTALEAAAKVHSDFAEGFVHVEVISVDELLTFGSRKEAKTSGAVKRRGEDYKVQNGDVLHFRTSIN